MKYSIIIPCYNTANFLDQCMLSLVNQTIGIASLEIILVDDCSPDASTYDKMLSWEQRYPDNIIAIRLDTNMKQGGARNIGLQYATGDYVGFVDSDDWINIYAYEYFDKITTAYAPDIIQFRYRGVFEQDDEYLQEPDTDCISLHDIDDDNRKWLLTNDAVMNQSIIRKIYKKELLDKSGVRCAEGVAYEEPLFTYPLKLYADRIVLFDYPLYFYRYNERGTTANYLDDANKLYQHMYVQELVWEFIKEQTLFFEKYYDEIELYFLHSFYYETICFAKDRGFDIDEDMQRALVKGVVDRGIRYIDNPYLTDEHMKDEARLFAKIGDIYDENFKSG